MMERNIEILDLRNGDVFIKFGANYAHIYAKCDKQEILDSLKEFEDWEEAPEHWDNNEIEHWEECYESDTTDLLTVDDLKEELENW